MKSSPKLMAILVLASALLSFSALLIFADSTPEGPTLLVKANNSRRTALGGHSILANAGNVTELNITGASQTQVWQGYYGNISGTITLDNAANATLYLWNLTSPEGEIYATELSSVTWTSGNVKCYNYTKDNTGALNYIMLTQYESGAPGVGTNPHVGMGINVTDVDGVDETFSNSTTHDPFYVGNYFVAGTPAMTASNGLGCPVAQMFNGTRKATMGRFEEVLLYDYTNNGVIYAALLESNVNGFDNKTWDFEMIVADNGHQGNTAATTYYFFVELE